MLLSQVIAELCHLFCSALACVLLYCHMCVADITVAFASLGSDMNCLTLTFAWQSSNTCVAMLCLPQC